MNYKASLLFAVLALGAGLVLARQVRGGIVGSKHDFSSAGWARGQTCGVCHAMLPSPNSSNGQATQALWNRALPPRNGYRMYVGGIAMGGQELDTTSLLCMSCHDGTIALDSFGGNSGSTFIASAPGANPKANLGVDLTKDHPVGAAAVWPIVTPTTLIDQSSRDAQRIMPLGRLPSSGRMAVGCASCHDPHDTRGNEHMLWVRNSGPARTAAGASVPGSALCLSCHKM